MVFGHPILLMRKRRIIKLLNKANAISIDSAKSLDEIGLVNPYAFSRLTKSLVEKQIINKTQDGKYYLGKYQ